LTDLPNRATIARHEELGVKSSNINYCIVAQGAEQGVKSSNINYCILAEGVAEAAVAAELSPGPAKGHAGGGLPMASYSTRGRRKLNR